MSRTWAYVRSVVNVPMWCVLAAIASGAMMAAGYWLLNLHFLAWVALVPYLIALPGLTAARVWILGSLMGLVYYGIGLAWLFSVNSSLALPAILGLAILMGYGFRIARLLMDRLSVHAMLWAVPLCFAGQEFLRSEAMPTHRFPFLAWGYSQAHNLWIAQISSIGGVYFLFLLLVISSSAFAYALLRRNRAGWATTESLNDRRPLPLVQQLCERAPQHEVYICVGAYVRAPRSATGKVDNVALLVDPAGQVVHRQAKSVPLPGGKDGNPARRQLTDVTLLDQVGIAVCYDAMFTDLPRRLTRRAGNMPTHCVFVRLNRAAVSLKPPAQGYRKSSIHQGT